MSKEDFYTRLSVVAVTEEFEKLDSLLRVFARSMIDLVQNPNYEDYDSALNTLQYVSGMLNGSSTVEEQLKQYLNGRLDSLLDALAFAQTFTISREERDFFTSRLHASNVIETLRNGAYTRSELVGTFGLDVHKDLWWLNSRQFINVRAVSEEEFEYSLGPRAGLL